MFVIKTECKEALAYDKSVLTKEGDKVWVTKDLEGWVPATSTDARYNTEPPLDSLTFDSYEKAEKFIKKWKGHPWYYVPNGNYEIIEVEQRYKQVLSGYQKKAV